MALSARRKAQLRKVGGRSLARIIRMVAATSEKISDPPDISDYVYKEHPCILACWHGQFMMISSFHNGEHPVVAMVARHGDAAFIGHAVEDFGVELIRGAGAGGRRKDRGGAHALRSSLDALASGKTVIMTADVPPGPARRVGDGIVKLAKMSGRPIVPIAAATSRYHAFDTWSRMTLNLPYSKLALAAGSHIFVPHTAGADELEEIRARVENELNSITARAYEMAGADPSRATPPTFNGAEVPPPKPGWGLKTYRGVARAIEPVAPLILRVRESQGKEDRARRNERMGSAVVERPAGRVVWFHAASVGETNAVLPVIERLRGSLADVHFLLTTGTVTSAALAGQRLGPRAIHQFAPLDGPKIAGRFLGHWRPDLAVFTESDVWPNLVMEASARDIPLALVNARMSNRSFSRWRKNKGLARPLFGRFDVVLAQDEKLARRFKSIGARNVEQVGNLKIDAPAPPVEASAVRELVEALDGRACFVAASTHDGEEEIVGEAHRILARRFDGFVTILAPRHPERGTLIAELLKESGLTVRQRSKGELPTRGCDIYIADTLGELGTLYSVAPIAFVGGSLVDKGGQNPIEAIRHGACVITGPHNQNFTKVYRALEKFGAVSKVGDAQELAGAVGELLQNLNRLDQMRGGAETAVSSLAGALDRTVAALVNLLARKEGRTRGS